MLEITEFADDAVWYVPDVADNREKDPEKQFAVLVTPMTARDLRRLEESIGTVTKGKINFTRRYNMMRERVLTKCVLEVTNCFYVVVKDGERTRKEITTGKELCAKAGEGVLEDIMTAIKDHSELDEGIRKNFVTPCSSTDSQASKKEHGGAQSVTHPSARVSWETQVQATKS